MDEELIYKKDALKALFELCKQECGKEITFETKCINCKLFKAIREIEDVTGMDPYSDWYE